MSPVEHGRVAALRRKGKRKDEVPLRVRTAPRVVVAARMRMRAEVGQRGDDAPERAAEGAVGLQDGRPVV